MAEWQPSEDWPAVMDQMIKGMSDFARIMGSYRASLAAEGIEGEQATALLVAYQDYMLGAQSE